MRDRRWEIGGDSVTDDPKRDIEAPASSYDRWLIGALVAVGLFAVLGLFTMIH